MNQHINELNALEGEDFWRYVLKFKKELRVILDNDETYVEPFDKAEDDDEVATACCYLGNSDGVCHLLAALEVPHEHC